MPAALDPTLRPKLRGVSHEWAFFLFIGLGILLIVEADGARATIAAAIYAASVPLLFGSSALYHRINWKSVRARQWMRRLDHSMIFVLIAGTYTPFCLLVLEGSLATAILIAVWAGAAAGIVLKLLWVDAPKWLAASIYVVLGWVAVVTAPQMIDGLGVGGALLVAGGGVLYTVGAVVYALRRPDPRPRVFGYHEIFHLLVIVACALQYVAIAFFALP